MNKQYTLGLLIVAFILSTTLPVTCEAKGSKNNDSVVLKILLVDPASNKREFQKAIDSVDAISFEFNTTDEKSKTKKIQVTTII